MYRIYLYYFENQPKTELFSLDEIEKECSLHHILDFIFYYHSLTRAGLFVFDKPLFLH